MSQPVMLCLTSLCCRGVLIGEHSKTEENTVRDDTAPTVGPDAEIDTELVEEESLVEEVSIDGMCGVY